MTELVGDTQPVVIEAPIDLEGQKEAARGILGDLPSLMDSLLGESPEADLDAVFAGYQDSLATANHLIEMAPLVKASEDELAQLRENRDVILGAIRRAGSLRSIRDSAMDFLGLKPKPETPQA